MPALVSACMELRARLRPSADAVDEFVRTFRLTFRNFLDTDWFETELLIREALNNAVLHGCPTGSQQRVQCILRVKFRTIMLVVCDGGNGFAWQTASTQRLSGSSSSGRGLHIYQAFADRVRFNTLGNRVILIKRLSSKKEL